MEGKTEKQEKTPDKAESAAKPETVKRLRGKEVGMVVLFLVLLVILTLKSNLFDEVKNLSREEQQFKDFVEYSVDRDYSGILSDMRLIAYRVIDIKMTDKDQKAVLRYEDPKTGEPVEVTQDGRYQAEVRGYLLWILPIKEFSVTAEVEK